MKKLPSTLEAFAFALQHAPGVGNARLRRILLQISQGKTLWSELHDLDARTLQNRLALPPEAAHALCEPTHRTLDTWDKLKKRGVEIFVLGQSKYPKRLWQLLDESAPPVLYCLGSSALFNLPAVGFCGSRKASQKGLCVAEDCAQLLAQEQINVVSGYAHGVDLAAHEGALKAGGTTTFVLAEGILNFRLKQQIKIFMNQSDFENMAVVSEFPPNLPWKAYNAMTRNRTICGLSNALIVIESGLEGGTFEAGKTALEIGEPLFCVDYADPAESASGNPYFLQHGAIRLRRSKSGRPNLSQVAKVARNGILAHAKSHNELLPSEDQTVQ